jgi:hypothetical protein
VKPVDDFKIWVAALLIGLVVAIASFDSIAADVEAVVPDVTNITSSSQYQLFLRIKKKENAIWASIKDITNVEPHADDTPKTVTPTPSVTGPATTPSLTTTPAINTTRTPVEPGQKIKAPMTIQLVGDSMMLEGFGPRLEAKLLTYNDVTVKRNGKYSTGLNRVDYFDWYNRTDELLTQNKPAILVVMYGANDGQDIVDLKNGNIIGRLGTAQWEKMYRERVSSYLAKFAPRVDAFYWVGHPIPRTDDFYRKFTVMNKVYVEECAKVANCHFVNEWDRFAINGKYSATVADDNGVTKTVKGSDGVHVTTHGGDIMSDEVIKVMKADVELTK